MIAFLFTAVVAEGLRFITVNKIKHSAITFLYAAFLLSILRHLNPLLTYLFPTIRFPSQPIKPLLPRPESLLEERETGNSWL